MRQPVWARGGWVAWRAGVGLLTIGPYADVTGSSDRPGPMLFGFYFQIWNASDL